MNSPTPNGGETFLTYAIRFTERARRELKEAKDWLASLTGDALADEWETGLFDALTRLTAFPTGYPLAANQKRFPNMQVRYMLYRRRPDSQMAYHLFFTAEPDTDDGPIVTIFHIRHAARRPITRTEAQAIIREINAP